MSSTRSPLSHPGGAYMSISSRLYYKIEYGGLKGYTTLVQREKCIRRRDAPFASILLTYPFPKQALVFTCLQSKSFENTVGKGEIARYEQFLLFPQCFQSVWRTFCHCRKVQNCRLQTLSIWKSLKFVVWERVKFQTAITQQFILFFSHGFLSCQRPK